MDAKEAIKNIRDAAESAKKHGSELISIEYLEKILNDIENKVASDESGRAPSKLSDDARLEVYRQLIQTEQAAIKSVILINGGGAFALLAFLGHIWNTHPSEDIVFGLSCSLLAFAFGVFAAAAASGTAYLAQFLWGRVHVKEKTGHFIAIISIIFVLVSLILFSFGCYKSYKVFVNHYKPIKIVSNP